MQERAHITRPRRFLGPLLLVGALALSTACGGTSPTGTDNGSGGTGLAVNDMTFVVHLPANTPASDEISFYAIGDSLWHRPMTRLDGDSAAITLSKSDFGPDSSLAYRYSRNASNYIGAEYLEPDTPDYFFTHLGRTAHFGGTAPQEDTVARWRWFPQGDVTPPEPTIDAPLAFAARVSGEPFKPGAFMQDLYMSWMDGAFQPTAEHLAQVGYDMAAVAPPWQLQSADPPDIATDPTRPDYTSASLTAQIEALRNAGMDVLLQPQVDGAPTLSGAQSTAWWDQWFEQMTRFLVFHAQTAEHAGAMWFSFYPFAQHAPVPPSDVDARYRAMIAAVRAVYSGRIGITFEQFSTSDGASYLIPQTSGLSWADDVDFFVLQASGAMVNASTASTAELVAGAKQILAPVQALAEQYGAPVLVVPVYASLAQSWRGGSFIDMDELGDPGWGGEQDWNPTGKFTFSEEDQARVLDAWYRAAAETPVVQSVLPFGYWDMDMPLVPDYSIRGKSAERVVEMWH